MLGEADLSQPSVEGQFSEHEGSWELSEYMVKVYDMSKDEHCKEYEELLSLAASSDPSVVVVEQDRQFCQNTENWKIFLTCALVRYKDLLDKKKGV